MFVSSDRSLWFAAPTGGGLACALLKAEDMHSVSWSGCRDAVVCVGTVDAAARPDDLWLVQITGEDVRAMTLDELDDAFQCGVIDEHTLVMRDGTRQWNELGLPPTPATGINSSAPSTIYPFEWARGNRPA